MFKRMQSTFFGFPRPFRTLVMATFIDRLGGSLIFPFLSLYVAGRFHVGMTEVGLLFGLWSASSFVGSVIGGALSDKFGRKALLLGGLVFSAGSALAMGFVTKMHTFYILAVVVGLFSDMGHPAQQAMVADLLQGDQRAEGFSVLRVVANLAVAIGPAIGGLLASVSYLLLFILDAVTSLITAGIVLAAIPETKPEKTEGQPSESILKTLSGYREVARDGLFLAFIAASLIMVVVYVQMYSTLSVYLNRYHDIPARGFGYMMSLNAGMVVLMQFWITRKIKGFPPMIMMVLASALYGIGYTMFGLVGAFWLFMLAIAIITIGEMVHIPISQALVARFAPDHMRGRYMAAFGLTWAFPNSVAPLLAGLVMDNTNPDLVWYLAGILSLVAVAAFMALHIRAADRLSGTDKQQVTALTQVP